MVDRLNVGFAIAALTLAASPVAMAQSPAVVSPELRAKYDFVAPVPKFSIVFASSKYDDALLDGKAVATAERNARRVAEIFDSAGYRPEIVVDPPSAGAMLQSIDSLMNRQVRQEINRGLRPIILIYYAGHGFSAGIDDFITARNFDKRNAAISGLPLSEIIRKVGDDADLFLFIDACRTAIDTSSTSNVGELLDASNDAPPPRSVSAETPYRDPDDSGERRWLGSYATSRGRIALGFVRTDDDLSPYANALVNNLGTFDIGLDTLLDDVWDDVKVATNLRQYPQVTIGGASGDGFFMRTSPAQRTREHEDWLAALASGDRREIGKFIRRHFSSEYVAAARRWQEDHDDTQIPR